jgi:hypothetical protein
VEFALVSVLLFPLLLGIIQYGLFFNDSINARQGIREAARQGVVRATVPVVAPCTSASTEISKLQCYAKDQVGALGGTTYIKVWFPTANGGWVKGNPIKVCAAVKNTAPGMLPMPNGGWTRSQTTMAVEQDATPVPPGGTVEDSLPLTPSTENWNWCTAP